MRKSIIPALILALVLVLPISTTQPDQAVGLPSVHVPYESYTGLTLSAAGGTGTPSSAVLFMVREISGLGIGIHNSYSDLSHESELDLASYLLPGWTLSRVTMDVSSVVAAPERKSLGVTPNTDTTSIVRIANSSGQVFDFLYQQFYNLPHDGRLENYSLTYKAPYYDTTLGHAFLVVRSNYTNPLANMTGWVTPWIQNPVSPQVATHDCSADNAILSADTYYYIVIDGGGLVGTSGQFNWIIWGAQSTLGLETGYRERGVLWDIFEGASQREADVKYTYTPWNTTSGSALVFSDPQQVGLQGNSSQLTGTTWDFESGLNITQLVLTSNQSVDIDYTLRLEYTRSGTPTTTWAVPSSGNQVQWNSSLSIAYPVVPNLVVKGANITVQSDWIPSGLYNSSNSGTSYEHYSKSNDVVTCLQLDDETWTLSCNAPNYVTSISLSDHLTSNPILDNVANTVDVDIDAVIQDGASSPITGGLTNLTVQDSLTTIYAPAEAPATSGAVSFLWDISATTNWNGTHTIEIFWTNGVEAGYRTAEVFVYYSTTLVPSTYEIHAYADDAVGFYISVDFDRVFPATGLDTALGADLTYTFESTINASMTDQAGGTWDVTIPTSGIADGAYMLYIYAVGYAFENRSLTIPVYLMYETQPLTVGWSNTDNISYLESTNLTIEYETTGGAIADATVNVTFQGSTYTMKWDSVSEQYWIQLNGTDFTGVPGTFFLNVSAWRDGYEPRYDDTIQITVMAETGYIFDVHFTPSRENLTSIDTLEIVATYNYGGSPIQSNTLIRATFNGSPPVELVFNGTVWRVTLPCSSYLGSWEVTVQVSADGYSPDQWDPYSFFVDDDPATMSASWSGSAATTDYATPVFLNVTLRDSLANLIDGANVTVTVYGGLSTMTFVSDGVYNIEIDPQTSAGVFLVVVELYETGYVAEDVLLYLTVQATTTLRVLHYVSEYEQWNLTITADYRDSYLHTPIQNATVTVTIDGTLYTLNFTGSNYTTEILLDFSPNTYTVYCSASEPLAVSNSSETSLTVIPKDYLNLTISFGGNLVAGQLIEVRARLTLDDSPVPNALVRFQVSVLFANGTVLQIVEGTMSDLTNNDGVASIGVNVPDGQVDTLTAQAFYDGTRARWPASASETTAVQVNMLSLLIAFLLSDIGLIIVGSMFLLAIVAAGYNKGVKPRKRETRRSLESQLQKFRDLQSIQHFMAVYLDRGTCVFYHPFRDERIEPDLISGFIAAITSVYGEIKGDGVRGTLEEIQYHGLRLNSYSGKYIIGILILEGEMTPLLRERLQFFVELFENQYEQDLESWSGITDCFDPEWIVSTLNSAFNYSWHLPHRFGPTQKVSKTDTKILDYIAAVRDERGEFYLKDLLRPLSEVLDLSEAATLDKLLGLQERGAIVPVGIQTILQRQGMGLANGEEGEGIKVMDMPEVLGRGTGEHPPPPPPLPEEVVETPTPEEEEAPDQPEEQPEPPVEEAEEIPEEEPEPEKQPEDELEKFVKDVEDLLSEKEKEDSD
jgi:hypothetical protein